MLVVTPSLVRECALPYCLRGSHEEEKSVVNIVLLLTNSLALSSSCDYVRIIWTDCATSTVVTRLVYCALTNYACVCVCPLTQVISHSSRQCRLTCRALSHCSCRHADNVNFSLCLRGHLPSPLGTRVDHTVARLEQCVSSLSRQICQLMSANLFLSPSPSRGNQTIVECVLQYCR